MYDNDIKHEFEDNRKFTAEYFFSPRKFEKFLSETSDIRDMINLFMKFRDWLSILMREKMTCNIIEECVYDFLSSMLSASQAFYKSACSQLRNVLELTILFIYYIDHPIEYREYIQGSRILTWSDLFRSELYFSNNYLYNFYTEFKIDSKKFNEKLINLYKKLSKYVHGRPKFRYIDSSIFEFDKNKFKIWIASFKEVMSYVNALLYIRFNKQIEEYAKLDTMNELIRIDILSSACNSGLIPFPKDLPSQLTKRREEVVRQRIRMFKRKITQKDNQNKKMH